MDLPKGFPQKCAGKRWLLTGAKALGIIMPSLGCCYDVGATPKHPPDEIGD